MNEGEGALQRIRQGRSAVIRRLLVLALCVPFLGCGSSRKGLDSQSASILTGATKVEVFRTDSQNGPHDQKQKKEGESRIGGYLVISQGKDQGKEFAARLADILSDKATYSTSFAKCFDPGVAFRIWKDEDALDVLICFKCDNFYYGPPTEKAKENGSLSHSPNRAKVLRLAKEAFPDDKEIQELKDK
jgi:hypothetical protein